MDDGGDPYVVDNMESEPVLESGKLLLGTPELVGDNILKYLGAKELLSLRRVCKFTKSWVSYSSRSAWRGYQLEILPDCDSWKTFDAAAQSGLNVTEIYINNPGDEGIDIYNSPGLSAFIHTYGPHIQKLNVRNFGTFEFDKEFDFFQSLTNLRELKIQFIDGRKRSSFSWDGSRLDNPPLARFPANFKNLKILKLGDILLCPSHAAEKNVHWDLINNCPQLEYLRMPVSSHDYHSRKSEEIKYQLYGDVGNANFFDGVMNYLKHQREVGLCTLQTLDLKYVTDSEFIDIVAFDLTVFVKFLCVEFLHHLELRNVHAEQLNPTPSEYITWYNRLITSLTNLVPSVRHFQLPNLDKLCINSTSSSALTDEWAIAPQWPHLKSISILIDGGEEAALTKMSHFLFRDYTRFSVEYLSIILEEDISMTSLKSASFISSKTLVRNFANIKVLEFERLNTRNRSFLRLWEGLTQLEELTIADCPYFGNVALIGEDPLQPTFLKLKKLWKLKLKLDKMPKLTDRAFQDVFCHMRIKELYLCSTLPLEK